MTTVKINHLEERHKYRDARRFESLVTYEDYSKNFNRRKRRIVDKLLLLTSQGIPAVYSNLNRDDLVLLLNVLLFKGLHGLLPKIENEADYAGQALATFAATRAQILNIKRGGSISHNVAKLSRSGSVFVPLAMVKLINPELKRHKGKRAFFRDAPDLDAVYRDFVKLLEQEPEPEPEPEDNRVPNHFSAKQKIELTEIAAEPEQVKPTVKRNRKTMRRRRSQ